MNRDCRKGERLPKPIVGCNESGESHGTSLSMAPAVAELGMAGREGSAMDLACQIFKRSLQGTTAQSRRRFQFFSTQEL